MEGDDVVLSLSGLLDQEQAAGLQDLLKREVAHRVVLDLSEVTLVDRDGVRFLARIEGTGVVLLNCPEYVLSWIKAELIP